MSTAIMLAVIAVPVLILAAALCNIAAREERQRDAWMHVDDQGIEEGDHDRDQADI